MSDTCFLELRCRKSDQKQFEDIGICEDKDYGYITSDLPYINLSDRQANYGASEALDHLASIGIPFYGWHGQGSSYSENSFAAAEGEIAWASSIDCDLVVRIDPDTHQPYPDDMNHIEKYFRLLRHAKNLLGEVDEDSNPG